MITGPDLEREADNYMEAKDMAATQREELIKQTAAWVRHDCANPTKKRKYPAGNIESNAERYVSDWLDAYEILGDVFQIVCSTESTMEIGFLVKQLVDKQIMRIAEGIEDDKDE